MQLYIYRASSTLTMPNYKMISWSRSHNQILCTVPKLWSQTLRSLGEVETAVQLVRSRKS